MNFPKNLQTGIFLKRYKRFFADIDFNGEVITAHCPNTGSMKGVNTPGSQCRFSQSDDPKRKLKYSLEMIKTPSTWVGVNTGKTNLLAEEVIQSFQLSHWQKFDTYAREVKINDESRMDFALWNSNQFIGKKPKPNDFKKSKFHFVEVKNVSLAIDEVAMFPDAVTTRGQKHIQELQKLIDDGHTAEMLYIIQREDCKLFSPADHIDSEYGKLLRKANKNGLVITALSAKLSESSIHLNLSPLPIQL